MRTTVAPLLVDLLTVLRGHRTLVVNLGLPWRGLYEYAAYLQALNNFRVLIGQWLLDGGPRSARAAADAEDFELVAWRTLGEGMLLIDMYEQWARSEQRGRTPASARSRSRRCSARSSGGRSCGSEQRPRGSQVVHRPDVLHCIPCIRLARIFLATFGSPRPGGREI